MTKSKKRKRQETEEREKKKHVRMQQEVQLKEVPSVPREHSRNGKEDGTSVNTRYYHYLKSIIFERKCPICGRELVDQQEKLSCPIGHIKRVRIGSIYKEEVYTK